MNFVWLNNQFGNQIWQIAVATFFFGRGNFAAITSYAVPLKDKRLSAANGLRQKRNAPASRHELYH